MHILYRRNEKHEMNEEMKKMNEEKKKLLGMKYLIKENLKCL